MKHDHSHDHDHQHDGHGCCGHDHSHEAQPEHVHTEKCCHGHEHEHVHTEKCSHGHEHEHVHSEKCSHEHVHGPHCSHGHDHDHDEDSKTDAEWTRRFFVVLQAVVLLMLGGVLCFFVATDRIKVFLSPDFQAPALWGGIGIIVMGLFNLMMMGQKKAECCHDHDHGEEDGDGPHSHSHEGSVAGRAVTLLLLSSSVAAAAILTPDSQTPTYLMYKESAARRSNVNPERLKRANPKLTAAKSEAAKATTGLTLERLEKNGMRRSKEGNYMLSLMDLYYMPSDLEYSRLMDGQQVEATGQLIKDPSNPGAGHMRLFVLQITCCAADAQPYSIPVVFEKGDPDFVDSGWYVVAGKVEIAEERGMKIARLKASDLKATIRPADQRMGF